MDMLYNIISELCKKEGIVLDSEEEQSYKEMSKDFCLVRQAMYAQLYSSLKGDQMHEDKILPKTLDFFVSPTDFTIELENKCNEYFKCYIPKIFHESLEESKKEFMNPLNLKELIIESLGKFPHFSHISEVLSYWSTKLMFPFYDSPKPLSFDQKIDTICKYMANKVHANKRISESEKFKKVVLFGLVLMLVSNEENQLYGF